MAQTIHGADILLVTVNQHETDTIKQALKDVGATPNQAQTQKNRQTYDDYGTINGQHIVHVTAMMGSSSSGASRETVKMAIEGLNPKLIIAVGIAWGTKKGSDQQKNRGCPRSKSSAKWRKYKNK